MDQKKIISLSKELRKRKNDFAAVVSQQKIHKDTNTLLLPKFPFSKKSLYPRTAPWVFNGFVLNLGEHTIVVDPGVDFLTWSLLSGINLVEPDVMFVSHAHLDHYAGAESVIEAMAFKQNDKNINLIAPGSVYEEKRISDYHSNIHGDGLPTIKPYIISKSEDIVIDDIILHPVELFHAGTPTFGFILTYKHLKLGYIADTGYTKKFITDTGEVVAAGAENYSGNFSAIQEKHENIAEEFKDVDVLLCCLNDFIFTKHSKFHMTGYDVIDILKGSKTKECVILHFNQYDLTNNRFLREFGRQIEVATKVPTISTFPKGLNLDLTKYL